MFYMYQWFLKVIQQMSAWLDILDRIKLEHKSSQMVIYLFKGVCPFSKINNIYINVAYKSQKNLKNLLGNPKQLDFIYKCKSWYNCQSSS